MKILCLFCELWLVEPVLIDGEVTCLRCSMEASKLGSEAFEFTQGGK